MSIVLVGRVNAEPVDNNNENCFDIIIVFARGSSENKDNLFSNNPFNPDFQDYEATTYSYFQNFKSELDRDYPNVTYKAHSLHNFDKYNPNGYKAVPAFSFPFGNIFNAEVSWYPGDYRQSVKDGAEELAGFVQDQTIRCPDQMIVLGGYSQGAHVVGDSLTLLSESGRQNIEWVSLFGDPEFIAGSNGGIFDGTPVPYPWKRGTVGDGEAGQLEPRYPYVPPDLTNKTTSWCFKSDIMCAGLSQLRRNTAGAHKSYATAAVPRDIIEVVQRLSPKLNQIEQAKNGFYKGDAAELFVEYKPTISPIKLLLLVNVSSGIDDVLGILRIGTPRVMQSVKINYPLASYAVSDFSEAKSGEVFIPRVNHLQRFLEYNERPINTFNSTLVSRLSYGGLSGGGADLKDPHILALERALMRPGWENTKRKHILLLTDRPLKTTYEYNICNSAISNNLMGIGSPNCMSKEDITSYPASFYSLLCDKIYTALTAKSCKINIDEETPTHNIERTLDDAIQLAQTKKIAVSVVIPHTFQQPAPHTAEEIDKMKKELEYLAKATGGLYLEYNKPEFKYAEYTNMMLRVLNHMPKNIALAYKDAWDILNDVNSGAIEDADKYNQGSVIAKVGVSTVFSVSGNVLGASSYQWDFNGDNTADKTTSSPNTEHTFSSTSTNTFVSVTALDNNQEFVAKTSQPLTVVPPPNDFFIPKTPVDMPTILVEYVDNKIVIFWEPSDQDAAMVIGDPVTGAPLKSVPFSFGEITFDIPEDFGDTLLVWAMDLNGESERTELPTTKPLDKDVANFEKGEGLGESVAGIEPQPTPQPTEEPQTASTSLVSSDIATFSPDDATPTPDPEVLAATTTQNNNLLNYTSNNNIAQSEQNLVNEDNLKESLIIIILLVGTVSAIGIYLTTKQNSN